MKLDLYFTDSKHNNDAWWDRVLDMVNEIPDRQWRVAGGSKGTKHTRFHITTLDGEEIRTQEFATQIVQIFVLRALYIEKFLCNGSDVTADVVHR